LTRREETALVVATAADYLTTVLADGPVPLREVKANADAALGFHVGEREWQSARERAGVASERVGSTWWWSLRSSTLAADAEAWLASPEGRFAEYLVQRERSRPAQLALDVEEGA
jgi:hypothetical protein